MQRLFNLIGFPLGRPYARTSDYTPPTPVHPYLPWRRIYYRNFTIPTPANYIRRRFFGLGFFAYYGFPGPELNPADLIRRRRWGLGLFPGYALVPFNAWQKINVDPKETTWAKINTTEVRNETVTVA